MTIKSYRDLDVYKRARKLIVPIYELADSLPADEKFDLRDQMRLSPSNSTNSSRTGESCERLQLPTSNFQPPNL